MKCLRSGSLLVVFGTVLLAGAMSTAQSEKTDVPSIVKRTQSAAEVLKEIMDAPDKGIPSEILDSADCVAITPSMLNAGIGFGGRYGKGVGSCRTKNGWSAPAP